MVRAISLISVFLLVFMSGFSVGAAEGKPRVVFETDYGAITIEVNPKAAPKSVADFLRYVNGGHYKDAGFYRTVRLDNDNGAPKIEVIQGGLLDTEASLGGVEHESTEQTGLKHIDGAVSLARGAVGTGSAAAFFICIGDQPGLDFGAVRNPDKQGFAVFGQVVEGMGAVRRIHQLPGNAQTDIPYLQGQIFANPVIIKTVKTVGPAQ
jgi:peptidyl-prolyl cis-trans isomerase A (cyclophilin A)